MRTFATYEEENIHYWTHRASGYSAVNREELATDQKAVWRGVIAGKIAGNHPGKRPDEIRVLDVGTGPGFFAIILAELGYQVTAVDYTASMLEEARRNAGALAGCIRFRQMNAEELTFPVDSFDVVVTRNVTWNLRDPERAYGQWSRVLKPGGVLLNFDADYAANVRSRSTQNRRVPADSPYGHVGMTDRLQRENDEITLTMDVGRARPAWDREVLEGIGFADCRVDTRVGRRILGLLDLEHAPMFGIAARKP